MERVPFVLVEFADGHREVFERADADVFVSNELVITHQSGRTAGVQSGDWLRATAYDAQGWPLYTHQTTAPVLRPKLGQPVSDARLFDILNELRLQHIARVLKTFSQSQLSCSSLQPVLDLAVELNPELAPTVRK